MVSKDKAYIVANEQQEREALEKLEREGYLWRGIDMKPTEQQPRIIDEPITIFAQDSKRLGFGYGVDEAYLADYEIEFDGRKEEHMSEKYVVSQEFMDDLEEWKEILRLDDVLFIGRKALSNLPNLLDKWWRDGSVSVHESNNRLIAIIRWVNGEDVFEVEKPKKWVVRSKDRTEQGSYLYVMLDISHGVKKILSFWDKDVATRFDTKEEAESWANAHQEVVEVDE